MCPSVYLVADRKCHVCSLCEVSPVGWRGVLWSFSWILMFVDFHISKRTLFYSRTCVSSPSAIPVAIVTLSLILVYKVLSSPLNLGLNSEGGLGFSSAYSINCVNHSNSHKNMLMSLCGNLHFMHCGKNRIQISCERLSGHNSASWFISHSIKYQVLLFDAETVVAKSISQM